MLHTKFQVHQPVSSWEDFESLLAYMGMAAILVMWQKPYASIPWRLRMKYGFNRTSVFEEKKFENVDKGLWMTLIFDIHKGSCTNLVDCMYQVSEKSIVLPKHKEPNLTLP